MRRIATTRFALVAGSTLTTFLVLELGARLFDDGNTPSLGSRSKQYDPVKDPEVGYRMRPSTHFRAVKKLADGRTCYDVVYSSDGFGRRVVGAPPDAATARPRLVLFGCSYTFGEGLADEDTLPYQLGRRFDVVTYAVHGYGPQHTLALLRNGVLERELPADPAIGVYVLHPFHLLRVDPDQSFAWLYDSPYFELEEGGGLHGSAKVWQAHPLRTFVYAAFAVAKEYSLLLRRIASRWPRHVNGTMIETTAAILIESARRFEERWQGPFFVAIEGMTSQPEGIPILIERLRAAGVAVIDESAIEIARTDRVCDGDSHPTLPYNAALAERLGRAITPR